MSEGWAGYADVAAQRPVLRRCDDDRGRADAATPNLPLRHVMGQALVVGQLPWPERFSVELRSAGSGAPVTYTVVTWLHERKAIVLAAEEHRRRYPDHRIYDVAVESLGPAPKEPSGVVAVGEDLHDRYEF